MIHDLEDTITCVYPDSEGEKRRMFFHELALYSDGTLNIVKKELKNASFGQDDFCYNGSSGKDAC